MNDDHLKSINRTLKQINRNLKGIADRLDQIKNQQTTKHSHYPFWRRIFNNEHVEKNND